MIENIENLLLEYKHAIIDYAPELVICPAVLFLLLFSLLNFANTYDISVLSPPASQLMYPLNLFWSSVQMFG